MLPLLSQLVPIRVGMILDELYDKVFWETCPHTRGDDPKNAEINEFAEVLSPYAWG